MSKIATIFLLFIIPVFCFSQTAIMGRVTDSAGNPIAGVTVKLLSSKDSGIIKMTSTTTDGSYSFPNIKKGNYLLSATHIDFQEKFTPTFDLFNSGFEVPTMELIARTEKLRTVTLSAVKPFIQMQAGKMVVNVDQSISNAGSNILEVLSRLPQVNVDADNNISINGKSGLTLLINGKQTFLSGPELSNFLKGQSADLIQRIEIITNPSSNYDAEGNAGIINIFQKKLKGDGFNGNLTISTQQRHYKINETSYLLPGSNFSSLFDYKNGKVDITLSSNDYITTYKNSSTGLGTYFLPSSPPYGYSPYNILFHTILYRLSNTINADWKISKKFNAGLIFSNSSLHYDDNTFMDKRIVDANYSATEEFLTNSKTKYNSYRNTFNLNWSFILDSTGKQLTMDMDAALFNYKDLSNFFTIIQNTNSSIDYEVIRVMPTQSKIYSSKLDFVLPLKMWRFQTGVKASFVNNDNKLEQNRVQNGITKFDAFASNHFLYTESIQAAYIDLNRKYKKIQLQGGLRLENTVTKGNQLTMGVINNKDYLDLFPSILLTYNVNKKNTITSSYSRRLNRPFYPLLNPFITYKDSLSISVGNPKLKPNFSDEWQITYSLKSKYFLSANYSYSNNEIFTLTQGQGRELINISSPINIGTTKSFSLSATVPVKVNKWWSMNYNAILFRNEYAGLPITDSKLKQTALRGNTTQSFKWQKGYSGEVYLGYRPEMVNRGAFDFAETDLIFTVQHSVFREKGSWNLKLFDPFGWTLHRKGYNYGFGFENYYEKLVPNRYISLSLSYHFGKKQVQEKYHKSSSQEEQSRI